MCVFYCYYYYYYYYWGGDDCFQVLLYVFVWRRLWEATQGPRPKLERPQDLMRSMFVLQRAFSWGPASVKEAFRKSMKSFCDGGCKKRFKVSICGEDKKRGRILRAYRFAYRLAYRLANYLAYRPCPPSRLPPLPTAFSLPP